MDQSKLRKNCGFSKKWLSDSNNQDIHHFFPKKVYWNTYYTQRKCAAIPIFEPRLLHRALIPCVDDTNVLIHAAVKDTLIKSEILQKICSFLQKKAELNGRAEGIVMQSNYYNAQLIYEFIQPIWKYIRQNSEM